MAGGDENQSTKTDQYRAKGEWHFLFGELGPDDRFEFVPGVDVASPVNDTAVFADHYVFRIAADDERRQYRLRVADEFIVEAIRGVVFPDRRCLIVSHRDENDVWFASELRGELVPYRCFELARRAADKPEIKNDHLSA